MTINPILKIIGNGRHVDDLALWLDRLGGGRDIVLLDAHKDLQPKAFDAIDDARFDENCIADVVAYFEALQGFLPEMRNEARIVFIIPTTVLGGWDCADQAAMAAMLVGLSRSLALELSPREITVNCIGVSAATQNVSIEASLDYLVSANANKVTGHLTLLDGGENLRMRNARQR
tara:strand:+ start:31023 stop:31547 length:525 start_codon:yes stop_codon:yes gene_type:complete